MHNSLVRFEKSGIDYTSIFSEFSSRLMTKYGIEHKVALGISSQAFPILESLSAGIALVCQQVANKSKTPLTSNENWEEILKRVNQVVSLGMLFHYKTAEKAALDYEQKVIIPFLEQEFPENENGLYPLFYNLAGKFFAGCISASTKVRRQIEQNRSAISENNKLRAVPVFDELERIFFNRLEQLNLIYFDRSFNYQRTVNDFEKELKRFEYYQKVQNALRKLPVFVGEYVTKNYEVNSSHRPKIHHRLPTIEAFFDVQFLLSALNADSEENILFNDLRSEADKKIFENKKAVFDIFIKRMTERGATLSPEDIEILWEYRQKKLYCNFRNLVNMTRNKAKQVDHREAINYINGIGMHIDLDINIILRAVRWQEVKASDIIKNFEGSSRLAELVDIISSALPLLREEEREDIIAYMINNQNIIDIYVSLYPMPMDDSVIPCTDMNLVTLPNGAFKVKTIKKNFLDLVELDSQDPKDHFLLLEEISRIDHKWMEMMFERETFLRQRIQTVIAQANLYNPRGDKKEILFRELRLKTFKKGLWNKMIFALEILDRLEIDEEYQEEEKALKWEEIPDNFEAFISQYKDYFFSGNNIEYFDKKMLEALQEEFKSYTEEELFRWFFASEDNLEEIWAEYKETQARYFS